MVDGDDGEDDSTETVKKKNLPKCFRIEDNRSFQMLLAKVKI